MSMVAARTDRGQVRRRNEDNYLVARLAQDCEIQDASLGTLRGRVSKLDSLLLLVADGMGGEAHGDRASRLVVEHFADFARFGGCRLLSEEREGIERILRDELRACHVKIRRQGEEHVKFRGTGSTATIAVVTGTKLHVAHVGDSRCYSLRDNKLTQITHDHSLAESLVHQGVLSRDEACRSPYRHQLWNSVGGAEEIIVEHHTVDLLAGDRVFLCTDGLTEHVCESQLERELSSDGDVNSICCDLVRAANDAGGRDNITVVLLELPIRKRQLISRLVGEQFGLGISQGAARSR